MKNLKKYKIILNVTLIILILLITASKVYAYFTSYDRATGTKKLAIENEVQTQVITEIKNDMMYVRIKNIGRDNRLC